MSRPVPTQPGQRLVPRLAGPARGSRRPRRMRGFGLLDGLVAMAILAFGLLALSRFQGRTVAAGSEAASRVVASGFGDELMSTVLVDVGNRNCYTLPATGVCGSAAAAARAEAWSTRAKAALPGATTPTAVLTADGRYTVTLNWTGKESQETRTLTAVTDVR